MKARIGFTVPLCSVKLVLLICAMLLILFPSTANTTPVWPLSNGNGLFSALSRCPVTSTSSYGKENGNDDDWHDCLQASSYIIGVVDALDLTPSGVTYGQDFEIVYAYLKNHVNQRQRLSVELIHEALVEAFPPRDKR
jgi:hypothetical protein